jgi:hypothetical protein
VNARRWSAVLFWLLTLGALVPVWVAPFLPTQDGPAHVEAARILERLIADDPRFTQFFDVRPEPLPNWTTQALLWFLLLIVPAAAAEKVLVTGYVIGFAWTYRRLALALQPQAVVVPLLGVLFCYSRCFWLGFYNYCLSMVLLFGLLSELAQHRRLTWAGVALLAYFGLVAYFTHLLGCLLTAAASLLAILGWYPSRWANLGKTLLAWLPSGCLTCWYFIHAGTAGSNVGPRWLKNLTDWLFSSRVLDVFETELLALGTQIQGPLALGALPAGWCLLGLMAILFYITIGRLMLVKEERPLASWPMLALGVLVTLAYFLGPEHLSMEQGGYLKQRFAVLMPLFLALLYREPMHATARWSLLAAFVAIDALQSVNLCLYLAEQNRDLNEYLAGREALGAGRVIYVMQNDLPNRTTSNPLLHAADYYCQAGENVNLDNYQAVVRHFPLCFVKGHDRGFGPFAFYRRPDVVDTVLVWDRPDPSARPAFRDFDLAFRQGRLMIFTRKQP